MVARILRVWDRSSDETRLAGLGWYDEARTIAEALSLTSTVSTSDVAGIIAALSNMTGWHENVRRAALALKGEGIGMKAQLAKVDAIMGGSHPLEVLTSNKVKNFYLCIMGDSDAVCIDRHAVAIVFNRPLSDKEVKILERSGVYDSVADAYREAGRKRQTIASAAQAATWLQWRKERGVDWYDRGTKTDKGA